MKGNFGGRCEQSFTSSRLLVKSSISVFDLRDNKTGKRMTEHSNRTTAKVQEHDVLYFSMTTAHPKLNHIKY